MIYEEKRPISGGQEASALLLQIMHALTIPIFYRNTEGEVLLCNLAFERFFGTEQQEILEKTLDAVQSAELAEPYLRYDAELIESPGEKTYEAKVRPKTGQVKEVLFQKTVILSDDGLAVGLLASIFDVTEQKKAEQKLERARESMIVSSHMLHKIRAGILIINKNFKIIDSNESFAELMGEDIVDLYETIPGLRGADLSELVPDVMYKMIASIMASGENNLERDVKYQNKLLHVSVVTIYKQRVVGAVIRDMSAPMLVRDEIIDRAQRVTKQNIETVQKIAFLLGENAAQTEELLHSIIETYKYSDDE